MSEEPTIELQLLSARPLSETVRSLRFAGPRDLVWEPGQYLELVVGGERRPYSIASAPSAEQPGALELAVSIADDNAATASLAALSIGARLPAHGPSGTFGRRRPGPAMFIGTGTGLAPLRAMVQSALRVDTELRVLFGCRTEDDILWRDELDAWNERGGVEVVTTLSRPPPGWPGRVGYVQTHLPELATALRSRFGDEPTYYVCGLPGMIDAVSAVLSDVGVSEASVETESYT